MTQEEKRKFRRSQPWSRLRQKLRRKFDKQDFITRKELTRTWNLHHLDMDDRHYTDLSKEDKFIPLNKDTHEFIHWLFRLYRHDTDVLRRIKVVLDMMLLYNPPRKRHEVREED